MRGTARWWTVGALATALVVAGCGGGRSAQAYCDHVEAQGPLIRSIGDFELTEEERFEANQALIESFEEEADVAPEEIADDAGLVAAAHLDTMAADGPPQGLVESDEVDAASERVARWYDEHCE